MQRSPGKRNVYLLWLKCKHKNRCEDKITHDSFFSPLSAEHREQLAYRHHVVDARLQRAHLCLTVSLLHERRFVVVAVVAVVAVVCCCVGLLLLLHLRYDGFQHHAAAWGNVDNQSSPSGEGSFEVVANAFEG